MGQPKKPRKAYRPRKMIIPPAFGTTCDMDVRLGLRMREAVDALTTGAGDWDDMMGCESELIVGIHLQRIAMARPTEHQVEMESLGELRSALVDVAQAMAAIKARHTATGRVGCSGEERQSILLLADLMDEMRAALPRRLWLLAYREALDRPVVRVQEVAS